MFDRRYADRNAYQGKEKIGRRIKMSSTSAVSGQYVPMYSYDDKQKKDDKSKSGLFPGVCYGPFRDGQSPDDGIFPTDQEMTEDLVAIKNCPIAPAIRTYGVDNTLFDIAGISDNLGIECYPGTWIDGYPNDPQLVQLLIDVANLGYPSSKAYTVGNEVMLRNSMPEATLISYIQQFKSAVPGAKVAYADSWYEWSTHPNIAAAVDVIMINIHPYWEGVDLSQAAQHVLDKYNLVKDLYPTKEIIIGETGWPTCGDTIGSAVPGEANQYQFYQEFDALAQQNSIKYFWFEAFDEKWKPAKNQAGKCWGAFYSNPRTLKPSFGSCTVDIDETSQPAEKTFPNPFTGSVNIAYNVVQNGNTKIEIFNSLGTKVAELEPGEKSPGTYSISWDGKNLEGQTVAPGLYISRITSGNTVSTLKLVKAGD